MKTRFGALDSICTYSFFFLIADFVLISRSQNPNTDDTLELKKRCSVDAGVEAKDCIKIKDMALKASVAYKNCKRCLRLCGEHRNQSCSDSDMSSKFHCSYQRTGCSYKRTGSSNSMLRQWGKGMESRLKVLSSGDGASSNDSQQVSIVRLEARISA